MPYTSVVLFALIAHLPFGDTHESCRVFLVPVSIRPSSPVLVVMLTLADRWLLPFLIHPVSEVASHFVSGLPSVVTGLVASVMIFAAQSANEISGIFQTGRYFGMKIY
ncbi:hypothetical protein CEXT_788291 [Caerostris extrusa]|uniref:Uncharacterized protein n=1 Tax=Caerostris extrusa TaxID=172846 RepID=A0AAV4YBE2_CAEEX|nr:hypothetical protein CEXT_788291 [Caerostris extrusa]